MSGRTLLAFGILAIGTLAAAPASACGSDDRFTCAPTTASSDAKSTTTASTATKSQRSAKTRVQKKRLAAKKATRNAARAKIIQPSRNASSRTTAAKRVEESPRVATNPRVEATSKLETPKRNEPTPPIARASESEKALTAAPAPRYEVADAESAALFSAPISPTSDLLSPVPTAGAPEIIRLATPSAVPETEQITKTAPINAAPVMAASEVPAPTVEFKSDPARLFATPAVASERPSPRKNAPSGLSWMQAILLALGGGIVAISTFKLFSASRTPV
jgi:hypothetical protein